MEIYEVGKDEGKKETGIPQHYSPRNLEVHLKNGEVKVFLPSEKFLLEYHRDFSGEKEFKWHYDFSPDDIENIEPSEVAREVEVHFKKGKIEPYSKSGGLLLKLNMKHRNKKEFENWYSFSPDDIENIVYHPKHREKITDHTYCIE